MLQVVVYGRAGEGKSTIARAIEKALSDMGFLVEREDDDQHPQFFDHERQAQRMEALKDRDTQIRIQAGQVGTAQLGGSAYSALNPAWKEYENDLMTRMTTDKELHLTMDDIRRDVSFDEAQGVHVRSNRPLMHASRVVLTSEDGNRSKVLKDRYRVQQEDGTWVCAFMGPDCNDLCPEPKCVEFSKMALG